MLLEALIGILIFSAGILALVGLQAAAINSVADAKYRTDASFLTNQIIAQMWVNRTNLGTYACNPCTTAPANGNTDTRAWVAQMLPTGSNPLPGTGTAGVQPQITVAAGTPTTVTVTVRWQPPQAKAVSNTVHSHTAIAYIQGP